MARGALTGLALVAASIVAGGTAEAQRGEGEGPAAAFELSAESGAAPFLLTVRNLSSGAESFRWEFGDGGESEARAPSHVYVRPGAFTVSLEACRGEECASAEQMVTVLGRDAVDGGRLTDGGRVYGSINRPGDVDGWSFVGEAGQVVTVGLAATEGSELDPLLRLFGPEGELVAFNDDVGIGLNSGIREFALPLSGRYEVEASGFLNTTGAYALELGLASGPAARAAFRMSPPTGVAPQQVAFANESEGTERSVWDFGDGSRSLVPHPQHVYEEGGVYRVTLTACGGSGCDTAVEVVVVETDDGGVVSGGESVGNRLDYVGDRDRFEFEAPAGAEVTIDLVAAGDAFDAVLELFDAGGELAGFDDDGGEGLNARIGPLTLPVGGRYTVVARAFDDRGEGDYTLTVAVEAAPLVRAAVAVEAVSFSAPAEVVLRDVSLGGPTRRTWRLDGVVVGTAAELLQRFEEAGRFRVELESCNARSCDGWAVVIEVSRRQAGGVLASNETVFGEIEGAGEVDVWTFTGEAGQRVTVGAEALALFGLDLTLELRSASGEVVAFDDDSGFARNPLLAGVALPTTGEFTLLVRTFDGTGEGRYQLELQLAAAGAASEGEALE